MPTHLSRQGVPSWTIGAQPKADRHGVFHFCWKPCWRGVIETDPKNLKHIWRFSRLFKFENPSMLRANLLPLDSIFRKKGTFHDDQLGKTNNLVNSNFSLSNFYNTIFWVIASMIFIFVRKWKSTKARIDINQSNCQRDKMDMSFIIWLLSIHLHWFGQRW